MVHGASEGEPLHALHSVQPQSRQTTPRYTGCSMLPGGGRRSSRSRLQPLQRGVGSARGAGSAGASREEAAPAGGAEGGLRPRRQCNERHIGPLTRPLGNGLGQRDRLPILVEQEVRFRWKGALPGSKQSNCVLRGADDDFGTREDRRLPVPYYGQTHQGAPPSRWPRGQPRQNRDGRARVRLTAGCELRHYPTERSAHPQARCITVLCKAPVMKSSRGGFGPRSGNALASTAQTGAIVRSKRSATSRASNSNCSWSRSGGQAGRSTNLLAPASR